MLSTLFTVAIFLTSFSSAATLPNSKRAEAVVSLPITAVNLTDLRHASKRQVVSPLANPLKGTLYLVSFAIGTPPQDVSLVLDTGSSVTWVDPTCSTAPSAEVVDLCNSFPFYDHTKSTTSKDLGVPEHLPYGSGQAEVELYTDNFHIQDATVAGQLFGVATSSDRIPAGIMGVGPNDELPATHPIIDSLALQGITNSRAFSLDLRSVDSPAGAIIFGGIDTMKYIGPLEKRPIIPAEQAPDQTDRYWIYMTSVGITKPGETPEIFPPTGIDAPGQPVFLDSGSTLTYLPSDLFNAIGADFPTATLKGSDYLVDCAVADQDGTVDFGFGGTIIHVPFREIIWHAPGSSDCILGIRPEDTAPVLGDSFLRAAFVVYDQDNQNVLLANAADCGTNLVAIGKGVDAVPSITGACTAPPKSSPTTTSSSTPTTSGMLATPPVKDHHPTTEFTISTVCSTSIYTITSCAPTVTDCPAKIGSVTTEIIPLYTTLCPVTPTPSEAVNEIPTHAAALSAVVTTKPSGPGVAPNQLFTGAADMVTVANVVAVLVVAVIHVVVFF